jgi:transcriptional regulator with XRE-family HTH domain
MNTKEPLLTDKAALEHVGERVRQLRLRKNITQSRLAKDSGVGKSTIERFEKGHSIQLTSLIRILRSFGKLDELLELVPDQTASPMEMLMKEEPTKYRASNKKKPKQPGPWKWGDE